MKKDMKKIFVFSLMGVFLLLLSLNFVAAQTDPSTAAQFFETVLGNAWASGDGIDDFLAKVLFAVILAMVIFGLLGYIPGVGSQEPWLKWVFSGIVSYLSMAYITPTEIYILMSTYSALGFVIGIAIPFLILAAFTYKIASSQEEGLKGSVLQEYFARGAWAVFGIIVIIRLINLFGDAPAEAPSWLWTVYLIFAILVFIAIFGFKWLMNKMRRAARKEAIVATRGKINKMRDRVKLAAANQEANAEAAEDLAGGNDESST